MGFLSSMDISASGMTAQRLRMDVISQNIANIDTTRTANGQPYRRQVVALSQKGGSFAQHLSRARAQAAGRGVVVSRIVEDTSDFKLSYDPSHPDAGEDGYVRYPNVDEAQEMIDMMSAVRAYEANVTALNATKAMALKALEIGR